MSFVWQLLGPHLLGAKLQKELSGKACLKEQGDAFAGTEAKRKRMKGIGKI